MIKKLKSFDQKRHVEELSGVLEPNIALHTLFQLNITRDINKRRSTIDTPVEDNQLRSHFPELNLNLIH